MIPIEANPEVAPYVTVSFGGICGEMDWVEYPYPYSLEGLFPNDQEPEKGQKGIQGPSWVSLIRRMQPQVPVYGVDNLRYGPRCHPRTISLWVTDIIKHTNDVLRGRKLIFTICLRRDSRPIYDRTAKDY